MAFPQVSFRAVRTAPDRQPNVACMAAATCVFRGRFQSETFGLQRLGNPKDVKRPEFSDLWSSLRKIYIILSARKNSILQRSETRLTSCPTVSELSFSFPAI